MAMPAWAEAQLPESMASNTPRQSFGTAIVLERGAAWVTTIGSCAAGGTVAGSAAGAVVTGAGEPAGCVEGVAVKGASGSEAACANSGAAQIRVPKANTPDFKIHPP
jgi:hypothetical protein